MKSNNSRTKSENFPRIDPKLVDLLERIYPPLDYNPEISSEAFARQAAFRAGQQEVVRKLKAVVQRQKEELYG
jgi:hypothetical protein